MLLSEVWYSQKDSFNLLSKEIKSCRLLFVAVLQNDGSTGEVQVIGGDTLSNLQGKVGSCTGCLKKSEMLSMWSVKGLWNLQKLGYAGDTQSRILYWTTNLNHQQSKHEPNSHISQFWWRICKFLASNRALFYLMQYSCTRKNLYKKAWHTGFFYKSTTTSFLYKILDSVSPALSYEGVKLHLILWKMVYFKHHFWGCEYFLNIFNCTPPL